MKIEENWGKKRHLSTSSILENLNISLGAIKLPGKTTLDNVMQNVTVEMFTFFVSSRWMKLGVHSFIHSIRTEGGIYHPNRDSLEKEREQARRLLCVADPCTPAGSALWAWTCSCWLLCRPRPKRRMAANAQGDASDRPCYRHAAWLMMLQFKSKDGAL